VSDTDNNPFNGISREPTNAELLAQWRKFMAYFPLGMALLWVEYDRLGQDWAGAILEHLIPVYGILAVLTFKREIVGWMLTLSLALLSGLKAFWPAFIAEFRK
jgi:hypothetical protein